jgi:hypothetical protein
MTLEEMPKFQNGLFQINGFQAGKGRVEVVHGRSWILLDIGSGLKTYSAPVVSGLIQNKFIWV